MIACQYHQDGCSLGLHGGKPKEGNCRECVKAGENNPEYAKRLFDASAITHPPDRPKVSGCCDPPEKTA